MKKIIDYTDFFISTKSPHFTVFPHRGKFGQLRKKKRVPCWFMTLSTVHRLLVYVYLYSTIRDIVDCIKRFLPWECSCPGVSHFLTPFLAWKLTEAKKKSLHFFSHRFLKLLMSVLNVVFTCLEGSSMYQSMVGRGYPYMALHVA